ncbi:hypothetical protein HPB48_009138 [Haemaphysalis longicornis]|uniref:Uncharacterized protein n=1 Tax=Haemaphysalis longicornis TaxID=44386 RepID=A0A9J6FRW1_HAELO|nr:hypothetical protein HPB48_009138 [Haemaphysalis longicornis]
MWAANRRMDVCPDLSNTICRGCGSPGQTADDTFVRRRRWEKKLSDQEDYERGISRDKRGPAGGPQRSSSSWRGGSSQTPAWSGHRPQHSRSRCEEVDLGWDHRIIRITVRGPRLRAELGKSQSTDWDKVRKFTQEDEDATDEDAGREYKTQSYEDWARNQKEVLQKFTREIATSTQTPFVSARLSNM